VQRLMIGWLAWGLAPVLVFVDRYVFNEHPFPRDSLSAYYWSGWREWFVLSLVVVGFFLIAYKVTEKNLDNTLSIAGGVAALFIPFFPTARTQEERAAGVPTTPIQNLFGHRGEHWVQLIHYAASFAFVVSLGVISLLFGLREKKRKGRQTTFPPRFWRWFHITCALGIAAGGAWMAFSHFADVGPYWSFLLGETICASAFGVSWFAKGFEMRYVLGKPERLSPVHSHGV
jgi:hypothetical protein